MLTEGSGSQKVGKSSPVSLKMAFLNILICVNTGRRCTLGEASLFE